MRFDEALPRLLTAYDSGRLTPFIGAGMSRPTCPAWPGLVEHLEERVGIRHPVAPPVNHNGADLIQRAHRAVALLKRQDDDRFFEVLRSVLYLADIKVPEQTKALVKIWWPLILSTNYDDLLFRAVHDETKRGLLVLGRSSRDCNRVLASLTTPSPPILWTLQGFLPSSDSPFDPPDQDRLKCLQQELVIGHEEYRQVTHRIPWFRRAFAEVFRSRCLLFMGAGLGDPYLLDLFGEVLELTGASPAIHFAFLEEGKADPQFLLSRFNIIALEYTVGKHEIVSQWLGELNTAIRASRLKQVCWSFTFNTPDRLPSTAGSGDFTIVRGALPNRTEGECTGISAGRENDEPLVGLDINRFFSECAPKARWLVPRTLAVCTTDPADFSKDLPLFLLVAREDDDTKGSDRRNLRMIGEPCQRFLDEASQRHYRCAHLQLLASGSQRVFPPTFAFVQQVRAIKQWFRTQQTRSNGSSHLAVVLHVVDPSVWFNILSGRLNLLEILQCDDMRVIVEVSVGEAQEFREFHYVLETMSLQELATLVDIPAQGWCAEIIPAPTGRRAIFHLQENTGDKFTLEWLGAVPGSTIRFFRPTQNEQTMEQENRSNSCG